MDICQCEKFQGQASLCDARQGQRNACERVFDWFKKKHNCVPDFPKCFW